MNSKWGLENRKVYAIVFLFDVVHPFLCVLFCGCMHVHDSMCVFVCARARVCGDGEGVGREGIEVY